VIAPKAGWRAMESGSQIAAKGRTQHRWHRGCGASARIRRPGRTTERGSFGGEPRFHRATFWRLHSARSWHPSTTSTTSAPLTARPHPHAITPNTARSQEQARLGSVARCQVLPAMSGMCCSRVQGRRCRRCQKVRIGLASGARALMSNRVLDATRGQATAVQEATGP
jgi:hypothetical protein